MAYIIQPDNPFKMDGQIVAGASGVDRLMPAFDRLDQENFAIDEAITGGKVQIYGLHNVGGRKGPTEFQRHIWNVAVPHCDPVLFVNIQNVVRRPIRHTFHDKLEDKEFFDFSGVTGDLTCYLSRPLLGTGYDVDADGRGANSGQAVYVKVERTTDGQEYDVKWDTPPTAADEVQINTTGAYAMRQLTFYEEPPNSQGVIRVSGFFLYSVAAKIPGFKFLANKVGQVHTEYTMIITELGNGT